MYAIRSYYAVEGIRNAEDEELLKMNGINMEILAAIRDHLE